MKKLVRVALVALLAALCVASLAMSATAATSDETGTVTPTTGRTPTGASGINYWAMDTGSYSFIVRHYESFTWETRDGEYTGVSGFTANYYHDLGGATMWDMGNPIYAYKHATRDSAIVVLQQLPSNSLVNKNPLKWVNGNQQYYAGANLIGIMPTHPEWGSFDLSVSEIHLYNGNTGEHVTLYPNTGTTILTSNLVPTDWEYTQVWYVFDLPEGFSHTASEFQLRHISLNQETRVNQTYNDQVTNYIPYNQAWFGIAYPSEPGPSYQEGFQQGEAVGFDKGYEQGYQQGATDAGGEPIQRWGAFLVTAVGGFLDFEIFPGFPLWGLLSACIAIPLAIAFLKLFAGG